MGSFVIGGPTVGALLGIEGITRDTFEPIGIFLTYPFVLAAGGDAPYSDMAGLAAHAKDNKVALGHFGYGLVPTRVSIIAGMELGFEFGSELAHAIALVREHRVRKARSIAGSTLRGSGAAS